MLISKLCGIRTKDIPSDAKYAKAFLWTTLYNSMPLCDFESISFVK